MTAKRVAQAFCWGKTHYFDDSTLRFFGSRVTWAEAEGGALLAVERLQVAWRGPRRSRAVRVEADGRVTRGPFRADTKTARADHYNYGGGLLTDKQ